ncbi:MAG: response regulator [Actinobacteria bacterium]|nr:MAG: response regulator [Actinomycetota bacterium]
MNPAEPSAHPVAVVDDDPKLRTRLGMQLGTGVEVVSFPSIEAMEEKFSSGSPLVVLFGPSFADPTGLKGVEALSYRRPDIGALLVVEMLSTEMLRMALRAGVRDVIELPAESSQLLEAIERVAVTIRVLPRTPEATLPAERPAELGAVITVFSAKGGVGKSVIASNLAVALARNASGPVVLVDADLKFGAVAVMLKLTPQYTVLDVVAAMQRLDAELLQRLLLRHEPSGLLVLPAPVEPAFADQVSASDMVKIVKLLQTFCQYIVIDTPGDDNDVVRALLEEADDILLIAGMDLPHIKNVKVGLRALQEANIPLSKVKLVVNRANSKVGFDVGEVERTLQMKADCPVPSDIVVPQSVNKGLPAVLGAPRSGVAKSMERLAELFLAGSRSSRDER